ncbi:MAG: hypothetical protein FJ304_23905 [Planctomycetes bacterium]|nr:hypothetical protein [Planctomycetota bacterium]
MRKMLKVTLAASLGLLAVVFAVGGSTTTAAEDKTPAVSEIMKKSFGKGGFKSAIPAAAKDGKWDDAQKLAKEWNDLGKVIGKNKPPKGEDASWKEQCAKFGDATKAILKATEDKDAKAVNKSVGGFNCGACHKAHKP